MTKLYALIKDNHIERINIELPTVIGNTSVPSGASGLEEFGLYAIKGSEPEYDPSSQVLSGPTYEFDGTYVNRVYLVTEADLSLAKTQKNLEINEARLKANFSTFKHLDKTFACDQLSRSDIDGTNGFVSLYGSLPPGWPGGWKAVDNSYIAITSVNDWKAFYSSMFAQGNANFLHAQSLKTRLEQATTLQEVQAITWDMEV